ncbi:MAG: ABC transporter ATP-binding protein [Verrucomicrobiales bacterium]|nr:ABC transporter ATP-binding protein [Verrucomicrobiales bacterium]
MTALEACDITCLYGSTIAVDQLSLKVPKGSIYGFLGVNGAGKTSTIKMLMGILPPAHGEICILGEWQKRVSPRSRRHLAYVSQEQFFYPWMKPHRLAKFVRAFYPDWKQSQFESLLMRFQLPANKSVTEMSGGMKTKLALALALSSQPGILILDEPTAGLDPVARREFMDIVITEAGEKGTTTFFSSHLVNEVEQCADTVGILHRGKLLHEGPLDLLMKQVVCISNCDESGIPEDAVVLQQKEDGKLFVKHSGKDVRDRLPDQCGIQSATLEEIFLAHVAWQSRVS